MGSENRDSTAPAGVRELNRVFAVDGRVQVAVEIGQAHGGRLRSRRQAMFARGDQNGVLVLNGPKVTI